MNTSTSNTSLNMLPPGHLGMISVIVTEVFLLRFANCCLPCIPWQEHKRPYAK